MDIKEPARNVAALLNRIPGNHLFLMADEPDFTIMGVTDAYLNVTNTRREKLLGNPLFNIIPGTTEHGRAIGAANLKISLQQVMAQKKPLQMEDQRYDIFNPATNRFEYRVWRPLNTPVFDEAGDIQYIVHTAEDVTEKLQLQQESTDNYVKLKEIDGRFRNLVEQAPVAILLSRGEDVVIEIVNNPMVRFMNKASVEELLGKKMIEALPELAGQQALQTVIDVQISGIPWQGKDVPVDLISEGTLKRHYFDLSYTPVVEAGVVTAVLHVAIDVTQQVETRMKIEELVETRTTELASSNAALVNTNAELTRSNNDLEEFAHAVSHDLKEPLRKIHFYKKGLKDLLVQGAREAEITLLGKIEEAAYRMGNLIEDLLQYSHVRQRVQQLEPVDLNNTLRSIHEELEFDIQEKKAVLEIAALPVVSGNGIQLHQLFENLVSNALKYSKVTEPPVISISSSLVTEEGKPYHCITVKDNGIGFDQKYAEQIFNMFSRLHSRNQYSGTGIGLSIVKRVLENHHGFVRAEGVPDAGSTFSVFLPAT